MTPLEVFGNRIGLLRQAAGLTQAVLAQSVGLSRGSIANIELGNQEPSATMVPKLARTLGVTCDELFGSEDAELPKLPWIELVTRVTASERQYRQLSSQCWDQRDVGEALYFRGMADGLDMARNHHADVIAEENQALARDGGTP